jgi:N-acetylmuramic acid 6-phosphate etherase
MTNPSAVGDHSSFVPSLRSGQALRPSSALGPTEQRNPSTLEIDRRSTREILAIMNAEDARVPAAVGRALPQIERVVEAIVARWRRGGRLFYFGAGTSGRLGVLDAAECPPTFSSPPELVQGFIAGGERALRQAVEGAEDDPEGGAAEVARAGVGPEDVVVGIAASGTTPYVLGALRAARERGAFTAGLACNPGAPLAALADVAIEIDVGPEVVTGSTRLKAGTAQKLVLNMLTTASMIRSGKVYGNLMVDLTATNAKLRRRAARIVAAVAGVGEAEAARLVAQTGYRAKPAIVMALAGCDAAEAERRLAAAGGMLRGALEALGVSASVGPGTAAGEIRLPLPEGEGWGEGGQGEPAAAKEPPTHPHPSPLPEGEGTRSALSAGEGTARQTEHAS